MHVYIFLKVYENYFLRKWLFKVKVKTGGFFGFFFVLLMLKLMLLSFYLFILV
jgi:hypothetical protein